MTPDHTKIKDISLCVMGGCQNQWTHKIANFNVCETHREYIQRLRDERNI